MHIKNSRGGKSKGRREKEREKKQWQSLQWLFVCVWHGYTYTHVTYTIYTWVNPTLSPVFEVTRLELKRMNCSHPAGIRPFHWYTCTCINWGKCTHLLTLFFFLPLLHFFKVRTLFVSGLPMDAKPRELYLLFRAYKVSKDNLFFPFHRLSLESISTVRPLKPDDTGDKSTGKQFNLYSSGPLLGQIEF